MEKKWAKKRTGESEKGGKKNKKEKEPHVIKEQGRQRDRRNGGKLTITKRGKLRVQLGKKVELEKSEVPREPRERLKIPRN